MPVPEGVSRSAGNALGMDAATHADRKGERKHPERNHPEKAEHKQPEHGRHQEPGRDDVRQGGAEGRYEGGNDSDQPRHSTVRGRERGKERSEAGKHANAPVAPPIGAEEEE